jgi:hypothetical protein
MENIFCVLHTLPEKANLFVANAIHNTTLEPVD